MDYEINLFCRRSDIFVCNAPLVYILFNSQRSLCLCVCVCLCVCDVQIYRKYSCSVNFVAFFHPLLTCFHRLLLHDFYDLAHIYFISTWYHSRSVGVENNNVAFNTIESVNWQHLLPSELIYTLNAIKIFCVYHWRIPRFAFVSISSIFVLQIHFSRLTHNKHFDLHFYSPQTRHPMRILNKEMSHSRGKTKLWTRIKHCHSIKA